MRAKWPINSGAAAIAFIVIMVACQDPGLGPAGEKGADFLVPALAPSVVGAEATDTVVTTFMTRPWVPATFFVGGVHKITFPAQSVCDPAVTRYGPTEWDKPCRPATQPVRIRAKS